MYMNTVEFNVKKFVKFYKRTNGIAKYAKKAGWEIEYGLSADNKPMIRFSQTFCGGPRPEPTVWEVTPKNLKAYCKEFNEDIDNIDVESFVERNTK